jgi:hypothetical protein
LIETLLIPGPGLDAGAAALSQAECRSPPVIMHIDKQKIRYFFSVALARLPLPPTFGLAGRVFSRLQRILKKKLADVLGANPETRAPGHGKLPVIWRNYGVCQKLLPSADFFKSPSKPPFSKGDFQKNSAKFLPWKKGERSIWYWIL